MNNLTNSEEKSFKEFCLKKLKKNKEFMQILNAAPKYRYKISVKDNDSYIIELKQIVVNNLTNKEIKLKIKEMSYYEFADLLFDNDECFYTYI